MTWKCSHDKVRTTCGPCKPDPRRDFLDSMGPVEPHILMPILIDLRGYRDALRRVEDLDLSEFEGSVYREKYNLGYPGGSLKSREWQWVRETVMARDGHKCSVCDSTKILQIDHIRPLSRGGNNSYPNLWTLCLSCHCIKHGRLLGTHIRIRKRR